ncbi:hypothetical protein [Streptomyces sp. NPDC087300]|uniref:hypothetical protein n=1 Tax=Streptomyces sp. NPDC087300 TaxID=3365780 RepID=UPI0038065C5F
MLLVTRAADDIELVECIDAGCEYVAFQDEAEALGWGEDVNEDGWRCEACFHAWAEAHGIPVTPRRLIAA